MRAYGNEGKRDCAANRQNEEEEDRDICHIVAYGRLACGGMEADVFFLLADRHRWQPMVLAARAESVFPTCLTRRLEGRGNLQNGKPDAGPHHSTGALDRRLECCARGDLRAMAVREVRWEGGWKRGRGPPDGLLVFEFLGLEMRQVGRVGKFRAC
jgi:hypothetical protein